MLQSASQPTALKDIASGMCYSTVDEAVLTSRPTDVRCVTVALAQRECGSAEPPTMVLRGGRICRPKESLRRKSTTLGETYSTDGYNLQPSLGVIQHLHATHSQHLLPTPITYHLHFRHPPT